MLDCSGKLIAPTAAASTLPALTYLDVQVTYSIETDRGMRDSVLALSAVARLQRQRRHCSDLDGVPSKLSHQHQQHQQQQQQQQQYME